MGYLSPYPIYLFSIYLYQYGLKDIYSLDYNPILFHLFCSDSSSVGHWMLFQLATGLL